MAAPPMATPVTRAVRPMVPIATSFTRTTLRPSTSTICLSSTFFHRSSSRSCSGGSSRGRDPLRMRLGPSMPKHVCPVDEHESAPGTIAAPGAHPDLRDDGESGPHVRGHVVQHPHLAVGPVEDRVAEDVAEEEHMGNGSCWRHWVSSTSPSTPTGTRASVPQALSRRYSLGPGPVPAIRPCPAPLYRSQQM